MSDRFRKIGDYFKKKREAQGLTQEEIAEHLGYGSKQIVSNWERGICSPPMSQVASLIELLDLDQAEVVELFLDVTRQELAAYFGRAGKKRAKVASVHARSKR